MSLYEQLNDDVKHAMKAGEKEKVGIYRMLLSEIKKAAIDQKMRDEITDELVLASLDTELVDAGAGASTEDTLARPFAPDSGSA